MRFLPKRDHIDTITRTTTFFKAGVWWGKRASGEDREKKEDRAYNFGRWERGDTEEVTLQGNAEAVRGAKSEFEPGSKAIRAKSEFTKDFELLP